MSNARKIVEEYGGVFLSDVVGLGKTFMGTMLCQELKGRTLVLAPPHLVDEHNQGSWEHAFRSFGFRAKDYKCLSIGLLDQIIKRDEYRDFDTVLIDEAHRFRTEETETYAKLAQICHGKKVILVTATPYNNSPRDLLAQIKLFQRTRQSTIPNLLDLEGFFKNLEKKLQRLDRQKDKTEYLSITRDNARLIRERVLKYLMVRRTRKEIVQYYGEDLKKQKMKFPEVANPTPIFYEFSEEENKVFFQTIKMITDDFKYVRYTPLLYFKGASATDRQSQQNMMKFMKMLLIKRLESSFYAFRKSIDRFIASYERFIEELEKNQTVYFSKKHAQKIFDYLDRGDLDGVDRLISEGKAESFSSSEFAENFAEDLSHDLAVLLEIREMWKSIQRDPKILAFKNKLAKEKVVQDSKLIIFTESQETAGYLKDGLQDIFPDQIVAFSGKSSPEEREEVMANFDANARNRKDDYKILITTDVLAEGANLHRANVVINYDIPWNPTRIMQRVGRINRVDTTFDKIYTYTFFPTDQSNDEIKLRECAEVKIQAFISLLGADAKLLTEDEIVEGHSLFSQLLSKEAIEGEDETESDLGYLQEIRKIRDDKPSLFEKIKRLPKKARTARKSQASPAKLLTYFRKGKLQKFFLVQNDGILIPEEIDFLQAAKHLSAPEHEPISKLDRDFYTLLEKNAEMLEKITEREEDDFSSKRGNRDNAARLSNILKAKEVRNFTGFTDDNEAYIERVIAELDAGGIPKKLSQKIYAKIQETPEVIANPIKLLGILKLMLPNDFLESTHSDTKLGIASKKEIILSEYFNSSQQ